MGQSVSCVNTMLRELASSLKSTPAWHLAVHVRYCNKKPRLTESKVLRRFREKRSRELNEALTIKETGNSGVSAP